MSIPFCGRINPINTNIIPSVRITSVKVVDPVTGTPGTSGGVADDVAPPTPVFGVGVTLTDGVGVGVGETINNAIVEADGDDFIVGEGLGVDFGEVEGEGTDVGVADTFGEGAKAAAPMLEGEAVILALGVAIVVSTGFGELTRMVSVFRQIGAVSAAFCSVGAVGATGAVSRNFKAVRRAITPTAVLISPINKNAQLLFRKFITCIMLNSKC